MGHRSSSNLSFVRNKNRTGCTQRHQVSWTTPVALTILALTPVALTSVVLTPVALTAFALTAVVLTAIILIAVALTAAGLTHVAHGPIYTGM